MTDLDRRTVLRHVAVGGALGAVAPWLAACGSDDDSGAGGTPTAEGSPADGDSPTAQGSPTDAESPTGGEEPLTTTGEVPVGGGAVFPDEQVVVTQPAEGEFLAFSAICTHQRCTVSGVSGGTINCSCHGSMFSIEDGSVTRGPAQSPLPEETIRVEGEQIFLT